MAGIIFRFMGVVEVLGIAYYPLDIGLKNCYRVIN
jgi:hypothetical protein